MTDKDYKTIKDIKNLEEYSKESQRKAELNARDFITGLKYSQFNNQFTGFSINELADSKHNVQHELAIKFLNKAAGQLVKLVNKVSDPDDLMGYEGQVMTTADALSTFSDFDDDPDCASADRDNIRFLTNTDDPYVVMVDGGDVKPVKWDDINNELDALKQNA